MNTFRYENEWPWGKTVQFICTDGLGTVEISREFQNNYAYISGLKVHPSVQKQGRGTALLKLAEQEIVKSLSTNIILLQVVPDSWVEKWYKRNGYCAFSKVENFNELIKIVKV